MRLSLTITVGLIAIVSPAVKAQNAPPAQPQPATSVQLPTFSQFSVQTVVSAPDRGGVSLGGVDRGVDSTISRGPIRNRASASGRSASSLTVHATIIDPAEMDRAILAKAAAERGAAAAAMGTKAGDLTRGLARDSGTALESVAAIRARAEGASNLESAEMAGYFAKAQQAETEGKSAVARIFYDMVARRDHGQLKQQAIARLAALAANPAKR
jgi:hypothetical protein